MKHRFSATCVTLALLMGLFTGLPLLRPREALPASRSKVLLPAVKALPHRLPLNRPQKAPPHRDHPLSLRRRFRLKARPLWST